MYLVLISSLCNILCPVYPEFGTTSSSISNFMFHLHFSSYVVSWSSCKTCISPEPALLPSTAPSDSDGFGISCSPLEMSEDWATDWLSDACSFWTACFGRLIASAAPAIAIGGGWGGTHTRCRGCWLDVEPFGAPLYSISSISLILTFFFCHQGAGSSPFDWVVSWTLIYDSSPFAWGWNTWLDVFWTCPISHGCPREVETHN